MEQPGQQGRDYGRPSVGLAAVVVILLAALWILFVAGVKGQEMLVGGGAVVLSAAFLILVYRSESQRLDLRLKDVAAGWRMPWYILSDLWLITIVLFKDLLHIKRAGSYYRVSGFKTSKTDPQLIARRVLATAYTTVAPNSIVIGIDYKQSRMLFHQIERSGVTKMAQELGAEPGGSS